MRRQPSQPRTLANSTSTAKKIAGGLFADNNTLMVIINRDVRIRFEECHDCVWEHWHPMEGLVDCGKSSAIRSDPVRRGSGLIQRSVRNLEEVFRFLCKWPFSFRAHQPTAG